MLYNLQTLISGTRGIMYYLTFLCILCVLQCQILFRLQFTRHFTSHTSEIVSRKKSPTRTGTSGLKQNADTLRDPARLVAGTSRHLQSKLHQVIFAPIWTKTLQRRKSRLIGRDRPTLNGTTCSLPLQYATRH